MTRLKRQGVLINVHPAILEQFDKFALELGISRNKLFENCMLEKITSSRACPKKFKEIFIARVKLMQEGL